MPGIRTPVTSRTAERPRGRRPDATTRPRRIALALAAGLAFGGAAPGGCSGAHGPFSGLSGGGGPRVVTGVVAKGPVAGAEVLLYAVTTTGGRGLALARAVTDLAGRFALDHPSRAAVSAGGEIFLLVARGGEYVNEESGAIESLGETELLAAALPGDLNLPRPIALTPASTIAARLAEARAGGLTAANVTAARAQVAAYFGGLDPIRAAPVDPADADAVAGAGADARDATLLFGGMARAARQVGFPSAAAYVAAAARDLSDGRADGRDFAGAPVIESGVALPADAAGPRLLEAVNSFDADHPLLALPPDRLAFLGTGRLPAPAVEGLILLPATARLSEGERLRFALRALAPGGGEVAGVEARWSLSDPARARLENPGPTGVTLVAGDDGGGATLLLTASVTADAADAGREVTARAQVAVVANSPPRAEVAAPTSPARQAVGVPYVLFDADGESDVSVAVEFTLDGGATFQPATPAPGGEGTTALTGTAAGAAHEFRWASGADLPWREARGVLLRVTPDDGGAKGGAGGLSAPFDLDNRPRQITATIETPASPVSNVVSVRFTLADEDDETAATATAEYSLDAGRAWLPATAAAGAPPLATLRAPPEGQAHEWRWESRANLPRRAAGGVLLRVTAADGSPAPAAVVVSGPFDVDNAPRPTIAALPPLAEGAPPRSFAWSVEYTLSDANDEPAVGVAVEHSADDGLSWKPASAAPGLATSGLRAAPEGTPHLFTWNLLADFPGAAADAVLLRVTPLPPTVAEGEPPEPEALAAVVGPFAVDNRFPTDGDAVLDEIAFAADGRPWFVEVVNRAPAPLDLSGWRVALDDVWYAMPRNTVVGGNGRLLVRADAGAEPGTAAESAGHMVVVAGEALGAGPLPGGGSVALLAAGESREAASVRSFLRWERVASPLAPLAVAAGKWRAGTTLPAGRAGWSICRGGAGVAYSDFFDSPDPTPGAAAAPRPRIAEVQPLPAPDGAAPFVEIAAAGPTPADLAGAVLDAGPAGLFTFPPDTVLEPGARLVVRWAREPARSDELALGHASAGLGASRAIALRMPSLGNSAATGPGVVVDFVEWGAPADAGAHPARAAAVARGLWPPASLGSARAAPSFVAALAAGASLASNGFGAGPGGWFNTSPPTPGAPPAPAPRIEALRFDPLGADDGHQTIVLSNPSPADADLSGWRLTTRFSGAPFTLPTPTPLPAGGLLAVEWRMVAGDASRPPAVEQESAATPSLATGAPATLAPLMVAGDSVALYRAGGAADERTIVHFVQYARGVGDLFTTPLDEVFAARAGLWTRGAFVDIDLPGDGTLREGEWMIFSGTGTTPASWLRSSAPLWE
ncbi:MAG: hypothetical protein HY719_04645 [Planctomycetes bacterium]|nr:hypothetical protein [Planctomycetota bacterium]